MALLHRFSSPELLKIENSFQQLELELSKKVQAELREAREHAERMSQRAAEDMERKVEHYHSENRTRLQAIDSTGNNVLETLGELEDKLQKEQLAAAADRVKIESLYGPNGGVALFNQRLSDQAKLYDAKMDKVQDSITELKGWVKWGAGAAAAVSFLMGAIALGWNMFHHH